MFAFINALPLTQKTPYLFNHNNSCFRPSSSFQVKSVGTGSQTVRMIVTTKSNSNGKDVSKGPGVSLATVSTPPVRTMDEFWKLADESKLNSQYDADEKIEFLKTASMEELRKVCLQYRYFVERYPDNLSYLVHKLPNIQLKSLLAEILSEELGSGKISGSHIQWYDRFLLSFGISPEELNSSLYEENEVILDEIERKLRIAPFEYGVGMVGMGGECLCQIYLTVMYKNLLMNPHVRNYDGKIDWHFWTYHTGEDDIEHRKMVRACIGELGMNEEGIDQLAGGYRIGKKTWDDFWTNNYKNTKISKQSN